LGHLIAGEHVIEGLTWHFFVYLGVLRRDASVRRQLACTCFLQENMYVRKHAQNGMVCGIFSDVVGHGKLIDKFLSDP